MKELKMSRKKLKEYLIAFWKQIEFPLLAVALGLIVGAFAMMWVGAQEGLPLSQVLLKPVDGYKALFFSVFGSLYGFGEAIVSAVPLIMTGLAIAFSFRTGLFNIGAEGQFIVGTFATAYVGFTLNNLPTILQFSLALIAGAIAGGLWAAIAGWLKAKRGVHEVITTIMMNHIAFYLYNLFVGSPDWFKAPNYQGSHAINPDIRLPVIGLFRPSRAHLGIVIALIAAVIIYIILWKTKLGYEVRAVGHKASAAEYGGIDVAKRFVTAMFISGILAGLGGGLHLLGTARRASQFGAFPNYGFDGIAVALIGKNHPLGIVLSAFLFAIMKRGAPLMQAQAGIAKEVIAIVQASIIFFVAADQIVKWIVKRKEKKTVKEMKEAASDE
ncbi:MAG: ABC transporter permease [Clostridia bacterium]